MKVCIHRGTKEIGGTCVEIEAQGKRIVLDIGLPLDAADPEDITLYPIPGFAAPDPSLLGVVISHPHQDHYGLAYRLPKETTFLIGRAAADILSAAGAFTPAGFTPEKVIYLQDRQPLALGPFTVTPYLVDHSAYDAYAVLVEADGKRLFYTGDFRAHGWKGSLVEKLIADPPQHVDVLLMEGTTLGRPDAEEAVTEADLVDRFTDLFRRTEGLVLVWASAQNIDRIVTLVKACNRARRKFIIDLYTAHILRATGNPNIPQASWDLMRVFLPFSQKRRIRRDETFDLANAFRPWRIFKEQIPAVADQSIMLFRPSMIGDLERMKGLKIGRLICSLWRGYLEDEGKLLEWVKGRGLAMNYCHTSGHASVADLQRVACAMQQTRLVVVHTEAPAGFAAESMPDIGHPKDGVWWPA